MCLHFLLSNLKTSKYHFIWESKNAFHYHGNIWSIEYVCILCLLCLCLFCVFRSVRVHPFGLLEMFFFLKTINFYFSHITVIISSKCFYYFSPVVNHTWLSIVFFVIVYCDFFLPHVGLPLWGKLKSPLFSWGSGVVAGRPCLHTSRTLLISSYPKQSLSQFLGEDETKVSTHHIKVLQNFFHEFFIKYIFFKYI